MAFPRMINIDLKALYAICYESEPSILSALPNSKTKFCSIELRKKKKEYMPERGRKGRGEGKTHKNVTRSVSSSKNSRYR